MNKTIKKELILLKDLGYRFPTQKSKEKRRNQGQNEKKS